jgi:hypothetical protein
MIEPIEPQGVDKRTKEYKAYKKAYERYLENTKKESKGLGDTIEKITKATGIKGFVDMLSDDCGCDERKEALNKAIPYKRTVPLTESDFQYLMTFFKNDVKVVTAPVQKKLNLIYNKVFPAKSSQQAGFTTCKGCLKRRINELRKVFKVYGI